MSSIQSLRHSSSAVAASGSSAASSSSSSGSKPSSLVRTAFDYATSSLTAETKDRPSALGQQVTFNAKPVVTKSLLLKAPSDFVAAIFPYLPLGDLVSLLTSCKTMHRFLEGSVGEATWRRYVRGRGIRLPGDEDEEPEDEDMDLSHEELQQLKRSRVEKVIAEAERKLRDELASRLDWEREIPDERSHRLLAARDRENKGQNQPRAAESPRHSAGFWRRVARFRLCKHRMVVGNLHQPVATAIPGGRTQNNHKWTCFVRSTEPHDQAPFIKEVDFGLHPTFHPPVVKTSKPPFEITRLGWGVFQISLVIHFSPEFGLFPPVKLSHYLSFSRPETSRTFDLDFSGSELVMEEIVDKRLPAPAQDQRNLIRSLFGVGPIDVGDNDDEEEEDQDEDE